jgi:hypothetical protein
MMIKGPKPNRDEAIGTCDWGDCDNATVDFRWHDEYGGWLTVCAKHTSYVDMTDAEYGAKVRGLLVEKETMRQRYNEIRQELAVLLGNEPVF